MLTRLKGVVASLAILAGLTAASFVAYQSVSDPCVTEDSVNCTWYADKQGNGQGQSFTTVSLFGDRVFIQVQR